MTWMQEKADVSRRIVRRRENRKVIGKDTYLFKGVPFYATPFGPLARQASAGGVLEELTT